MTREEEDPESSVQEYTLERGRDLSLRFRGILVGYNDVDIEGNDRGTHVQIFVTTSRKIVTAVHQWQRKKGRKRHKAQVHESPEAAMSFLMEDGGGKLGRASREAWIMACNVEPTLKGYDAEVVY